MFRHKLNPIEPPWYGPVCPVVWEGRRREASPYPDLRPKADSIAATSLYFHHCVGEHFKCLLLEALQRRVRCQARASFADFVIFQQLHIKRAKL